MSAFAPLVPFGVVFENPFLLQQALTHRSHGKPNYERLEFLGDSLLNAVVSELLYALQPGASEGELSRGRARLIQEASLAALARELRLGEHLRLGPGEMKTGGHRRDSILADTLEALVAAIYIDRGWDVCRAFLRQLFAGPAAALGNADSLKDPKTRLQERLQAGGVALPNYELLESFGEEHAKVFRVRCAISAFSIESVAEAPSRRAAEQAAAEQAIALLPAKVRP